MSTVILLEGQLQSLQPDCWSQGGQAGCIPLLITTGFQKKSASSTLHDTLDWDNWPRELYSLAVVAHILKCPTQEESSAQQFCQVCVIAANQFNPHKNTNIISAPVTLVYFITRSRSWDIKLKLCKLRAAKWCKHIVFHRAARSQTQTRLARDTRVHKHFSSAVAAST